MCNTERDSCEIEKLLKFGFLSEHRCQYVSDQFAVINKGRPMPAMPNLFAEIKSGNLTLIEYFDENVYNAYPWLTGCPVKNKLFCWPCILFATQNTMWSWYGFKDINNLHNALGKHDGNKNHLESIRQLETFGAKRKKRRDEYNVKRSRYVLSCFIDVVCFLVKQDLPFGEFVDGGLFLNRGHYFELLKFISAYDKDLKKHFQSPIFTCVNPQMSDQIVCSIGSVMTDFIRQEINKTKFVSIMLNQTSDKSQISVYFRYIKSVEFFEDEVIERFMKLIKISEYISIDRLFEMVDGIISDFGVGNKLICQTYDGATVMTKGVGGLQAKLKQKYPNALFIQNHSDDLNLTLQQSLSNIEECDNFFKILIGIGDFFTAPESRIGNSLHYYMFKTFKKKGPTLLEFSTKLVYTVKNIRVELIGFFENIVDNPNNFDSQTVILAGGCAVFLKSFDTCFLLDVICAVFLRTDTLFRAVQTASYDITYCCKMIEYVKFKLKEMREKSFDFFFQNACKNATTKPPEKRKNVDTTTLYKKLFCDITNKVLVQITERFEYYKNFEFSTLVDCTRFEDYDKELPESALKSLIDTYKGIFNMDLLSKELDSFYDYHAERYMRNKPLPLLFKRMKDTGLCNLMPELYKLLRLLVTLPTTVKPTFSTLKKMKSFPRSFFEEVKHDMVLLKVEKHFLHKLRRKLSYSLMRPEPNTYCKFTETVIEKFCLQTKRKEFIYRIIAVDGASTSGMTKNGDGGAEKNDTTSEESDDSRCSFEEITSDVEENADQPAQNDGYESFLSNSGIVIKQEIIETEQESSVFDHSESQSDGPNSIKTRLDSIRPITSHWDTQFDGQEPRTSHSETQFDGQRPSTPNVSNSKSLNLPTVRAKSNESENSSSIFSKENGALSVKPTISDSSKAPTRTEVPTQTESPSLSEVITSDVYMYDNESTQPEVSSHSCSALPVRDKFDALGELIASRLRKLDPQSSAYVQTAFLDILSKAESGLLLNNNDKNISAAQYNNIQKDTLSNESENVSGIENITPEARQDIRNPASNSTKLLTSLKNPTTKPKVSSNEAHQLYSPVRSNTGSENSLKNPHINNPLPLVLHNTVPEKPTVCDTNQTGVSSHMVVPSLSPVSNYASPCTGTPRFPFQMRARDEFDAYGEFVALKLRKLDQRSCAFVQSGFANLIFEAELGRFLSKGEKSIFANKTNEILRNVPPPSGSELGILSNVA